MKTPPVLIADYYRRHAILPDQTIDCMEYALKTIYNELSKFVIYLIVFAFLDLTIVYLIAYCAFVSLRIFAGGIHCKSYWGCFWLSFIMISGTIALAGIYNNNSYILWVVALLSWVFPLLLSPVTPSFRIIKNKKNIWILKVVAVGLTLIWAGVAFLSRHNTVITNVILIAIIVTNYQLIIPKWISKRKVKPTRR